MKQIILALALLLALPLWSAPESAAHQHKEATGASHDDHDHAAESPAHDHEAETDDHDDHDDHGDEAEEPPVHLTAAQKKLIRIQLSKAEAGNLESILRLNGEIKLNLERTAKIMPRMPGFVTAVTANEGETVRKGQLLATLTSHKLGEYYSDFNSASELEKLMKAEFERAEKLRSTNAIAEKEYLQTQREYADAVIARKRAEALLESLLIDPAHDAHPHPADGAGATICTQYEIRAPFDGAVIGKNIAVGENFPEDNATTVFTVSDLSRLWLELRADNAQLRLLKSGMSVTVTPAGSDRHDTGKIIYVAPVIDESTRTGLVRVLLENPDGRFRPGEFATGTIRLDSDADAVVVPRDAIQLIAGESVVFVPQGDGFAPRPVVPGASANGMTRILSGLKPGEEYVSGGAFELKSVLLTSGMDPHAGHGH